MPKGSMKCDVLTVEGDHMVTVGDATIFDVTDVPSKAEETPRRFAEGDRVFEVIYDSSTLGGVESVFATTDELHSFVEILYMCQRSSRTHEWEQLPPAVADVYDGLLYVQASLYASDGYDVYQSELQEMEEEDRFNSDPPEWVVEAMNRSSEWREH